MPSGSSSFSECTEQTPIAAQCFIHRGAAAGELRRIEDDDAKTLLVGDQAIQAIEHVGFFERDIGQAVQAGRWRGPVAAPVRSASTPSTDAAPARRHAGRSRRCSRRRRACAGLTPAGRRPGDYRVDRDSSRSSVLRSNSLACANRVPRSRSGQRGVAGQRPVLQFQAFELADAALGAQIDAVGLQQFHQQIGDQCAPFSASARLVNCTTSQRSKRSTVSPERPSASLKTSRHACPGPIK